jgi:hypothetical protein
MQSEDGLGCRVPTALEPSSEDAQRLHYEISPGERGRVARGPRSCGLQAWHPVVDRRSRDSDGTCLHRHDSLDDGLMIHVLPGGGRHRHAVHQDAGHNRGEERTGNDTFHRKTGPASFVITFSVTARCQTVTSFCRTGACTNLSHSTCFGSRIMSPAPDAERRRRFPSFRLPRLRPPQKRFPACRDFEWPDL